MFCRGPLKLDLRARILFSLNRSLIESTKISSSETLYNKPMAGLVVKTSNFANPLYMSRVNKELKKRSKQVY